MTDSNSNNPENSPQPEENQETPTPKTQPEEKTEAETPPGESHEDHHGPSFQSYMVIFSALCILTASSFLIYRTFGIGSFVGASLIMGVSVVKATLVGMFFMHLKYDWGNLYFLIIPLCILTLMVIICLLPDMVLTWSPEVMTGFGAAPPSNPE